MALLLPSSLFGRYADVDRAATRIARSLAKGASWTDAIGPERDDPAARGGFVVLDGPSPLLGGGEHWHAYLPLRRLLESMLKGKAPREREQAVFESCLQDPTGVVALMGANLNTLWVAPEHRHRPLLAAAIAAWGDLAALGPRFSAGSASPDGLWNLPSNLKYVLANLGVPTDELARPLPPEGLGRYARLV